MLVRDMTIVPLRDESEAVIFGKELHYKCKSCGRECKAVACNEGKTSPDEVMRVLGWKVGEFTGDDFCRRHR